MHSAWYVISHYLLHLRNFLSPGTFKVKLLLCLVIYSLGFMLRKKIKKEKERRKHTFCHVIGKQLALLFVMIYINEHNIQNVYA